MNQNSGSFEGFKSSGCAAQDTRNNWVTMMFATKYRFTCFGKQSHIETCTVAFRELETFGFEFGEFGFGGTHVHFLVNIPKKYSVGTAEIMLIANLIIYQLFVRFARIANCGKMF